MNPVIIIPEADLVAILGRNGEHWVQQSWGDGVSACLHGAIRRCQPQPGDAFLIEQVANRQAWGTQWNDATSTTWQMVRDRLANIQVTDADLADTFGPQWEAIVALIRRAAIMTAADVQQVTAPRPVARAAARVTARSAALAASRTPAWAAAVAAARDVVWDGTWAAAAALVVRDLIGQHGFTQEHYDTLTGPWRTVIGPVHPDDAEVAS
jgi:hypothetical protein